MTAPGVSHRSLTSVSPAKTPGAGKSIGSPAVFNHPCLAGDGHSGRGWRSRRGSVAASLAVL
jgi:hypothetical protein